MSRLDNTFTHAQVPIITIDGPSGAGKGTICRSVAHAKGFYLLDSGSLYRLTALFALQHSVSYEDQTKMAELAQNLPVEFKTDATSTRVFLSGDEVSAKIREEHIGMAASIVAAQKPVRAALLARQRAFAIAPGLVADGRDMGTVVFPSAQLKIFLTASAEERASRRVRQLGQAGQRADYEKILSDVKLRDERDSSRAAAPLKPATDAVILDSTTLSIEEVFNAVIAQVNKRKLFK